MARKEARIFTGIWGEADWRGLSAGAQWLYMFLISQPDIAHDGVISLRERRWASSAQELSPKEITCRLEELERAGYAVVDDATEEVLVRSFMRHDQVYLQPNLMAAAVAHLPGVESHRIRRAIYAEISRIVRENSDRARAGQSLPPLTEKQKVPIRQMVGILRRSGDGAQELTAGPEVKVRPVELPPETTTDDLRSKPRHETRPNGSQPTRPEGVTGLGHDLGQFGSVVGQTDDPDFGHSDPLSPAGSNPSGNPSPNPLGDRGMVTQVSTGAPFPSPLTPTPSKTFGHDLRSNSADQLTFPDLDEPATETDLGPPDPLMADFGTTPERSWSPSGAQTAFERFWAVYPLKVKKGYARKCWDRAVRQATPERIIRGAKRYAEDPNRSDEFTAHPSSWLNQGRWDDAPLPARGARNGSAVHSALDAAARRRAARTAPGGEITDGRR